MNQQPMSDQALAKLQRDTFGYFQHETNLTNGMVPDNTRTGAHASIAAIGLGLATYPVAVERAFISREEAVERVLTTLRFFWMSPQGTELRCHRLQRFLLSLPSHGYGTSGVGMRTLDDRLNHPDRRRADSCNLLRSGDGIRTRDSATSRRSLSPHELAMGDEWWR